MAILHTKGSSGPSSRMRGTAFAACAHCPTSRHHIVNILFGEPRATSLYSMIGPASGMPALARTTLQKIFSQLAIGVTCRICAAFRGSLKRSNQPESGHRIFWDLARHWKHEIPPVNLQMPARRAMQKATTCRHCFFWPRLKCVAMLGG